MANRNGGWELGVGCLFALVFKKMPTLRAGVNSSFSWKCRMLGKLNS